MYPSEGSLRRELYIKHMLFFRLGGTHEKVPGVCPGDCDGSPHTGRCFMGGNRTGKTICGSYEAALHATGMYPDWWEGKRWKEPVSIWCAGKTNETTRDIVQHNLFGDLIHDDNRKAMSGTGMVPQKCIGLLTWKPGLPDLIDVAKVKHVSGGWSKIGLKTYEQGRGAFEGTSQHHIWIDEEAPFDVYQECRIRLMSTDGQITLTFTPLSGMSEVVMDFLNVRPAETKEDNG